MCLQPLQYSALSAVITAKTLPTVCFSIILYPLQPYGVAPLDILSPVYSYTAEQEAKKPKEKRKEGKPKGSVFFSFCILRGIMGVLC